MTLQTRTTAFARHVHLDPVRTHRGRAEAQARHRMAAARQTMHAHRRVARDGGGGGATPSGWRTHPSARPHLRFDPAERRREGASLVREKRARRAASAKALVYRAPRSRAQGVTPSPRRQPPAARVGSNPSADPSIRGREWVCKWLVCTCIPRRIRNHPQIKHLLSPASFRSRETVQSDRPERTAHAPAPRADRISGTLRRPSS